MRVSAGGWATQLGAVGAAVAAAVDADAAAVAGGLGGVDSQTPHCPLLQSSCMVARRWVGPGRRRDRFGREGSGRIGRWQGADPGPGHGRCVDIQTGSDPWCGESSEPVILQT